MSILRYLSRKNLSILSRGFFHPGFCPACGTPTLFFRPAPYSHHMREYYRCLWCRSTPRYRSFSHVLDRRFPSWRECHIHESSPGGSMSHKLKRACANYVSSDYHPNLPRGAQVADSVNQDLQSQTFSDNIFDLVITMDVLEHLPFPEKAIQEIRRTLKPGGAHVFTVPCDFTSRTVERASLAPNGEITHHQPPVYHGNPIDNKGSLVFRDWGCDLPDFIRKACGMETEVIRLDSFWQGIPPDRNEVFISRKNE